MHVLSRALFLTVAAVLLAACGGDEGSGSEAKQSRSQGTAEPSREGYFTSEQSEQLNPALATYSAASKAYYERGDACGKEAAAKFAKGASPKESVACHVRDVQAMIRSVGGVERAAAGIEGEWREPCTDGIKAFEASLARQRTAWQALLADWNTYGRTGQSPKQIDAHSKRADELTARFINEDAPALAKACYTKADREAATSDD